MLEGEVSCPQKMMLVWWLAVWIGVFVCCCRGDLASHDVGSGVVCGKALKALAWWHANGHDVTDTITSCLSSSNKTTTNPKYSDFQKHMLAPLLEFVHRTCNTQHPKESTTLPSKVNHNIINRDHNNINHQNVGARQERERRIVDDNDGLVTCSLGEAIQQRCPPFRSNSTFHSLQLNVFDAVTTLSNAQRANLQLLANSVNFDLSINMQIQGELWSTTLGIVLKQVSWAAVKFVFVFGTGGATGANLFTTFANVGTIKFMTSSLHLHPDTFSGTSHSSGSSRLHTLFLRDTGLTSLPNGVFRTLPSLQELDLSGNSLQTPLTQATFRGLSSLQQLFLSNNGITALSPGVFSEMPALQRIELHINSIQHLQPDVFGSLSLLEILYLNHNQLQTLPPSTLAGLPNLRSLTLNRNNMASIHPQLLANHTQLALMYINHNPLVTLDEAAFSALRSLNELYMHSTMLESLPTSIFDGLQNLRRLAIHNNPRLHITSTHLKRLTRVNELFLNGLAAITITEDLLPNTPFLTTLDLHGTPVQFTDSNPTTLFSSLQGGLTYLSIGWPALTREYIPVETLCSTLNFHTTIQYLRISGSSYTSIDACTAMAVEFQTRFHNIDLSGNALLSSVTVSNTIQLHLNDCPLLFNLQLASAIPNMDISNTNIPSSTEFCNFHGTSSFFARNMLHHTFQNQHNMEQLLARCHQGSHVFDLTGASPLHNIDTVASIVGTPLIVTSEQSLVDLETISVATSMRLGVATNVPLFVNDGSSIECRPVIQFQQFLVGFQNTVEFQCSCSTGTRRSHAHGNRCISTALSAGQVAAIAIAAACCGILIAVLAMRRYQAYVRKQQKLMEENELHVHLIEMQAGELTAMKEAWRIDDSELHKLRKLDEGAFGEVWQCEWDSIIVAVKYLKECHAMMLIPHSTGHNPRQPQPSYLTRDFEKEVEFFQRMRHQNLVRFFGTGTDSRGAPFIVLEYVALGSLRSLLDKGLKASLEAQAAKITHGSGVGHITARQLRARIANDIAQGMEYIHSNGILHRDLKAGNVLVTQRMRAKLTDFGSISRKLLDAASSSGSNNSNSYTSDKHTGSKGKSHGGTRDGDGDLTTMPYSNASASTSLSLTSTSVVGTPLYMAPEVLAMAGKVNGKSDVFSYGVLLWEIATEQVPDLIAQEVPGYTGPLFSLLRQLLEVGKRLEWPDASADDNLPLDAWYCDLSSACMQSEQSNRPSFAAILSSSTYFPTSFT